MLRQAAKPSGELFSASPAILNVSLCAMVSVFFIELAYNSHFLCKFAKYNQYDSDMNKIRYINMCIVEFGKKFSMPADIAFNYLKQYKALAFLDKCYEAEHQLSLADTIKDIQLYCRKNGGTI